MSNKFFVHQGTQYKYSGNEGLAHSHFHEVRNHLLGIKRTNVNNLPIVYGTKRFDDGTVAQYQLIHGREIVNVVAPIIPVMIVEENVARTIIEEIEQIVPVFRSTDNNYWVACLSGTFEPEYYLFNNIYDIPTTAFDDNIETDIDKQLISIGEDPIEGEYLPELYFIAQTGVRPRLGWYAPIYNFYDSYTYDGFNGEGYLDYDFTRTVVAPAAPPTDHPWIYLDITRTEDVFTDDSTLIKTGMIWKIFTTVTSSSASLDHYVWGKKLGIQPREISLYTTDTESWRALDLYGNVNEETYATTTIYDYTITTVQTLRCETESINNFSCCYLEWRLSETEYYTNPPPVTTPEEVTYTRTYKLQVNNLVFDLLAVEGWQYDRRPVGSYDTWWVDEGPKESISSEGMLQNYGAPDGSQMKYYGPNSIAPSTCLFCGRVDTSEPVFVDGYYSGENTKVECVRFDYHYVGPNKIGITTTTFTPNSATEFKHTIPGIRDSQGDLIEFRGEVFLGLMKYEVETVIEDR